MLKSGRHSDAYLEKFQVLQDPAATSELCGFWAAAHRDDDGAATVDLVAGPTTGGVILAFETGRQLGTRAIFAEEVASDDGAPRREFRRGFTIGAGERVLLVDDILTTGGSLLAMIPAVEAAGGEIVECVVLVDRSGGLSTLTSPATGRVYPAARPVAARAADLRARRGDLPALRGGRTGGQAREQRHRPGSRVSAGPGRDPVRWPGARRSPVVARAGRGCRPARRAVHDAGSGRDRLAQRARERDAGRRRDLADRRVLTAHRLGGPDPGHGASHPDQRRPGDRRSRSARSRTAPSSRRATWPSTWPRRRRCGCASARRARTSSCTASRTRRRARGALARLRARARLGGPLLAQRVLQRIEPLDGSPGVQSDGESGTESADLRAAACETSVANRWSARPACRRRRQGAWRARQLAGDLRDRRLELRVADDPLERALHDPVRARP